MGPPSVGEGATDSMATDSMATEIAPQDTLTEILSGARAYVTTRDETKREEIRATLLERIKTSQVHPSELIGHWIRQEEENVAIRLENQNLESEADLLRSASLAEEPVIPPRMPAPKATPRMDPVTATEVLDIYAQYAQTYDARLRTVFYWKTRALSAEEGKVFFDTCSRSQTSGSMYLVGTCHRRGIGVPLDMEKAIEWYTRSADMGNPESMISLVLCLREQGLPPSSEETFRWYQQSAQLGHPLGMAYLGNCYEHGIGIHGDRTKAVECYTKSAELGEPFGMVLLARQLERGTLSDQSKALDWWTEAMHRGNLTALHHGLSYGIRPGFQPGDIPAETLRHLYNGYRLYDGHNLSLVETQLVLSLLRRLMCEGTGIVVLEHWIREQDETAILELRRQALRAEVEAIRTELEYRPGGPGYREACHDFELRRGPKIEDESD